jgi:preprotein translocase subunit SecD
MTFLKNFFSGLKQEAGKTFSLSGRPLSVSLQPKKGKDEAISILESYISELEIRQAEIVARGGDPKNVKADLARKKDSLAVLKKPPKSLEDQIAKARLEKELADVTASPSALDQAKDELAKAKSNAEIHLMEKLVTAIESGDGAKVAIIDKALKALRGQTQKTPRDSKKLNPRSGNHH